MEITLENLATLLKKLQHSTMQNAKHCRDNGLESVYALQMKKAQTLKTVIWLIEDQKFFDDLYNEWIINKQRRKLIVRQGNAILDTANEDDRRNDS